MRFESPWAFLILLALPLGAVLRIYFGRGVGLRFPSTANVSAAGKSLRQRALWLPTLLRVVALILLAIALARPRAGTEIVRDLSEGIAIEMVVDRSSSMEALMIFGGKRMTRLEVVKRVFAEFVDGNGDDLPGRPNDLIGMVAFARYPDTICPLTLGHGALNEFLETVQLVRRRNEDGTAIGDAIALAAARLKRAEESLKKRDDIEDDNYEIKSKVIILLTDGQNNQGKHTPLEAAALAAKWGIKVHTIGIGEAGRRSFFSAPGVDVATLKAVADATGGIFRLAGDTKALREVCKEIDELEKSEVVSIRYVDYREMFTPFALAALCVLAAEIILRNTVFRRIP